LSAIGVLAEGPLHAALKAWLAGPGDRVEVPVEGFVIDLVRGDGELVEVQTGGFGPLARKLDRLLDSHRMRIVHPVTARRRVVRVDPDGEVLSVRRAPLRADWMEVFDRLVSFPSLLSHPNLVVEVLLTAEDHVRDAAPVVLRGRRRDPGQRRLVEVLERVELRGVADVRSRLSGLPAEPFSTRELAAALGCRRVLAGRIVYCLRGCGMLEEAGRAGRAPLYRMLSG
jgi:hypothetical protein